MADIVDFGTVQKDLEDAEFVRVMQVLQRDHKWNAANQAPMILILTNRHIYNGGTDVIDKNFFRISLKDITSAAIIGKSIIRCVEVKYIHGKREKRTYLCPFEGSPTRPRMDIELMMELQSLIEKLKNDK